MINFKYQNPTKIYFGDDALEKISLELDEFKGQKCLLVYGQRSAKKNGTYDIIIEQLLKQDIRIYEHFGVSANPTLSHAYDGVKLAKENNVDFIIGVGGGSVIDESKAIALGAVSEVDIWDFYTKKTVPQKALPLYAIMTMPATASEINPISVLTNEKTKEKLAVFAEGILNPKASFLDPTTTFSLPYDQVVNAAVDIISHLSEAYFTTSSTICPVQDGMIEGIIKAVIELVKQIKADPNNYESRASFMWAATLGWNRICQLGMPNITMPCHGLEMPMSGIYNVAHGAGLAVITPAWLKFESVSKSKRIVRFGEKIFNLDSPSSGDVISALEIFYKEIGAPTTFLDLGIDEPDINRMTDLTLEAFKGRNITEYSRRDIENIYELAL